MKIVMLLCSLFSVVPAAELEGKVVGVKSGCEVEILSQGAVIGVRIQGIVCPRKGSSAGKAARRHLADLAFLNEARAKITGAESAGAFIGVIVMADGRNLGEELIRNGMARCDTQAGAVPAAMAKLEMRARDARLGLWAGVSNDDDDEESGKEVLVRNGTETGANAAFLTR
jgi:endonuclease YncB( thermonuclease family)